MLQTSAGPDFCTGRVRDAAGPLSPGAYTCRDEYSGIFGSYTAVRETPIPVVVAIEERAMGYGAAVAALCSVSFASETAQLNVPEIENNAIPTMVMSVAADRMSRNAILWMAYLADFIDAWRALTHGIISTVVPAASLLDEAERFCRVLLNRPWPAILGLEEYLRVAPRMDERGVTDYAQPAFDGEHRGGDEAPTALRHGGRPGGDRDVHGLNARRWLFAGCSRRQRWTLRRQSPGLQEEAMRDEAAPWRTDDLVYLEREINYWAGSRGYAACTAAVQEARAQAARYGMDRVVVLPAWAARYEGALQDIVAGIDPAGLVAGCDGAEIVIMPTPESLGRFVAWCEQHVRWERGRL